jgi:NaMN:DMB phosphoribosyltransferase
VALGEIGIGNTTVAAVLAAALLDVPVTEVVGRGASADAVMVERKVDVVERALARLRSTAQTPSSPAQAAPSTAQPPRSTVHFSPSTVRYSGSSVQHSESRGHLSPSTVQYSGSSVQHSESSGQSEHPGGVHEVLRRLGGGEFAVLTGVVLGVAEAGGVIVLDGLATSVCALAAVRLEPAVAAHLVAGQRSRERAHALVLTELGLEPILDLRIRAGEGVGAALAAGVLKDGMELRRSVARTVPRRGRVGP